MMENSITVYEPGVNLSVGVVITADVVNSTQFASEETERRLTMLIKKLQEAVVWRLKPEVFRGDSFQGVLAHLEDALRISVLARALLKEESWDLRVAIGVGEIARMSDRPGTSDGEAFRLSGQLADVIKKDRPRIGVALPVSAEPIQAVLALLEAIMEKWTPAQAAVVAHLLTGNTMNETAEILKISQSAVSQHAQAARWWAIAPMINTFAELVKAFYPHD